MKNPSVKTQEMRRKMGFTQKSLAEKVGCSPSAISMFEGGNPSALSVEKLNKVCEVLGLEQGSLVSQSNVLYCPNALCPTHHPYRIGNRIHFMPEAVRSSLSAKHCGWCGEVLNSTCETCQALFEPGKAFCPECGVNYVSAFEEETLPSENTLLHLQQLQTDKNTINSLAGKEK